MPFLRLDGNWVSVRLAAVGHVAGKWGSLDSDPDGRVAKSPLPARVRGGGSALWLHRGVPCPGRASEAGV